MELPVAGQTTQPAPLKTSRWSYFWFALAPVAGLASTAIVAVAITTLLLGRDDPKVVAILSQAITNLLFLVFIVWLSLAKRAWLSDPPIERSAWWRVKALAGCWALMIGFGMVLVLSGVIDPKSYSSYQQGFRSLLAGWPPVLAWSLMVFIAPLAEELAFRRWMLSVMPKAIGLPLGVSSSMLLFALIHFPGFIGQFLMLLSLSATTTWLWMKTRDWRMCWALHALNNAQFLLALSATGP